MEMRIGYWKINGTLIDGERYTIWAAAIDQNAIWERQPPTTVKDGSEFLKSEVSHESISNKWFSKSWKKNCTRAMFIGPYSGPGSGSGSGSVLSSIQIQT